MSDPSAVVRSPDVKRWTGIAAIGVGIVLWLFVKPISKLMGGVR